MKEQIAYQDHNTRKRRNKTHEQAVLENQLTGEEKQQRRPPEGCKRLAPSSGARMELSIAGLAKPHSGGARTSDR